MKHHILAIGVSKQQYLRDIDLAYASKDAKDFYNLLTSNLSDLGYSKLLIDSEATLSQIKTALGAELQSQVEPDDVFFFFFSGHGATAETDEPDELAHYLLPFDASQDIASSCISVTDLQEVFEKLKAKAKLVCIDSCFSGSMANSKGYNHPSKKDPKTVKTFVNTVTGTGSLIFAACKESEEALEDTENHNGLFTHFLLSEMQKDRDGKPYAITDTFGPVMNGVIERAKKRFHHIQTPTQQSHLQGPIMLPAFQNRLKLLPQTIAPPRNPELANANFQAPIITLTDKEQEKLLNATISFVMENSQSDTRIQQLLFQQYCNKLIKNLQIESEKIFEQSQTIESIPDSVAKIEAASFQLVLLGAVAAVFGTNSQMTSYGASIVKILGFGRGKSGLVAAITIPEVVVAIIVHVVGVLSLAHYNLMPFRILLSAKNWYSTNSANPPSTLAQERDYHYCDALGTNAIKVNEHIRLVLASYDWLKELLPDAEVEIINLQLQVNFLLVMVMVKKGQDPLWPDFGRSYAERILPLVQRIKYDKSFEKEVADFLEIEPDKVLEIMRAELPRIQAWMSGSGFFWSSIQISHLTM